MKRYLLYGTIIGALFVSAGLNGFSVGNIMQGGRLGGGLFGHSQQHK
ncbi:MAG: hypothetical protein ACYC69_03220 [Thermodesulfovibrionales bacterium]